MEIGQTRQNVLSAMKMSSIVRRVILTVAASHLALLVVSCGNSSSPEIDSRTTGSGGASHVVSLDGDHLASHLLKKQVENEDGLELGRVKDLALDEQTGQAVYVVIASGGTLGFGKRLRAVPVEQVSTATTKINTLAVNLDGPGWQNLPLLGRRDLVAQLSARTQPKQATNALSPTGREIETSRVIPDNKKFELASQLLRRTITNRANEKVGELTDLLVDLSSSTRPTYAIVSSPDLLIRPAVFAIPLELLHPENGSLKIDAGRNEFESAPLFDDKAWTPSPLRIYKIQNDPSARSG